MDRNTQDTKRVAVYIDGSNLYYKPSHGFIRSATETRLLTKNDIKEFENIEKEKNN